MSFRCDICGKAQPAGTKPEQRVVETRRVVYTCGSKGTEIVKVQKCCASC